jgi:hypothetical protein
MKTDVWRLLDVDPQNLAFEFKSEWGTFRNSRLKKFFQVWLHSQLEAVRLSLESSEDLDKVRKLQGKSEALRQMLSIVESESVSETLEQMIKQKL